MFSSFKRMFVTTMDRFSILYRIENLFIFYQSIIMYFVIGKFHISENHHIPQAILVINKVWGIEFPRPIPINLYLLGIFLSKLNIKVPLQIRNQKRMKR
jgi:hypothetical protein